MSLSHEQLIHNAVNELRDLRDQPPYAPAADVDLVWAVSAPGTYLEPADDGAYAGKSFDAAVINHGIGLVQEITAQRLGKDSSEVTRDDIVAAGPVFYYNGEHAGITNHAYRQNEHLREAASDDDFPLPESKMVVRDIEAAHTPAQVADLVEYLNESGDSVGKIAVVSLAGHSVRVGRYLQQSVNDGQFPADTMLERAAVPLTEDTIGTLHREVTKTVTYYDKGHLAGRSHYTE